MNGDTVLLRQVHPSFIHKGRVTSQAFRPTPKDEHKLSTYDGDQIEPQPAYQHYTDTLHFESVGVQGVTVAECGDLKLPVTPDKKQFPEHVVIDFSEFNKKVVETKAKSLRDKALTRGWLYQATAAQ